MGNKKSWQRKADTVAPGDRVAAELGLNTSEWLVAVGYSKGILSRSRYTHVSVRHLPTGRERSESFDARGKAAARRNAIAVARRLVQELRQG